MRKRFLFDVDGILADFCRAAAGVMTAVSGRPIDPGRIDRWEVTDLLDSDEHKAASKAAFQAPGFCRGIPVYDGAVEAMDEIRRVADVFFVTAPMHKNKSWVPERLEWLEDIFKVDAKHVVFAYKKYLVKGDLILEDSGDNAADWAEHHPGGTAMLWDRPYNAADRRGQFVRVSSWEDVLREVRQAGGTS